MADGRSNPSAAISSSRLSIRASAVMTRSPVWFTKAAVFPEEIQASSKASGAPDRWIRRSRSLLRLDPRWARLSSIRFTSPLSTGFPSVLYRPTMALTAAFLPRTATGCNGIALANLRSLCGLGSPPRRGPLSSPLRFWRPQSVEGLVRRVVPAISARPALA